MSFTVADILLDVRELIQDSSAATPRFSDAFIIRKINQVVRRCVILRPDLFTYRTTFVLAADTLQTGPSDSVRIMDIMGNSAGDQVKEVSQDVLDLMVPTWPSITPGVVQNWMRFPRDPNRFYVYPKPVAADTVDLMYARCPPTMASGDTVPMQDVYFPVVVDGTVWLMESVDAEHVESGRAKMFQDSFMNGLTGSLAARRLVDSMGAGMPKDEVIT